MFVIIKAVIVAVIFSYCSVAGGIHCTLPVRLSYTCNHTAQCFVHSEHKFYPNGKFLSNLFVWALLAGDECSWEGQKANCIKFVTILQKSKWLVFNDMKIFVLIYRKLQFNFGVFIGAVDSHGKAQTQTLFL